MAAVGATDARETMMRVAALEELIGHISNDRSPETEVRLIPGRIDLLELVEVRDGQLIE